MFKIDLDTLDKLEKILYGSTRVYTSAYQTREYLTAAYPNACGIANWQAVYHNLAYWLFYEELLNVGQELNLVWLLNFQLSPPDAAQKLGGYWDLIKFETESDLEKSYQSLGNLGKAYATTSIAEQHPRGKPYRFWPLYNSLKEPFYKVSEQLNWKRREIQFSFVSFNASEIKDRQLGCVQRASRELGSNNLSALNFIVNQR